MIKLLLLKSITFAYDIREDRVLGVINPRHPPSWSCWLTRRHVLALLQNTDKFLANTSTLAQRAAPEARKEVVAFEREAAVAKTAAAMSVTPPEVIKTTVAAAELLQHLKLSPQGEHVRLELRGIADGGASAVLQRAELQRILQMLQIEGVKAGWLPGPAAPAPASAPRPEDPGSKPVRH